jgi:hypothetical protein
MGSSVSSRSKTAIAVGMVAAALAAPGGVRLAAGDDRREVAPVADESPEAAAERLARRDEAEALLVKAGDAVAALDPRTEAARFQGELARIKLELARKLLERGQPEASVAMADEALRSASRASSRARGRRTSR